MWICQRPPAGSEQSGILFGIKRLELVVELRERREGERLGYGARKRSRPEVIISSMIDGI